MGGSRHSTPSCPLCSPVGSSVDRISQFLILISILSKNLLILILMYSNSLMDLLRDHMSATSHGKESSPASVMSLATSGLVRSSASRSMYRRALRALCGGPGTLFCTHDSLIRLLLHSAELQRG